MERCCRDDPWDIWVATGDQAVLERQWESARAWVDLQISRAGDSYLWQGDFQLGDWLDPTAPPDEPAAAMTNPDLVASAYFAWSAAHLAKTAEVIGKQQESHYYAAVASKSRLAIAKHYLTEEGLLAQESQTGYALIIAFDLAQSPTQQCDCCPSIARACNCRGIPYWHWLCWYPHHLTGLEFDRLPGRCLSSIAGARLPILAVPD